MDLILCLEKKKHLKIMKVFKLVQKTFLCSTYSGQKHHKAPLKYDCCIINIEWLLQLFFTTPDSN